MYVSTCGTQRARFRIPLKAGSDAQGAGRRCVLDVREPPGNAAREVPLPTKTRVLMRKAPGGDAYWTYVSLPGTQRIRFRDPLFAALLYKIEKLGLSMHPDLHIDVPDMGLRRVERDAEFVGDKSNRATLGEKEQDVRLTL